MKKVAIGCVVVLALMLVAGGFGTWWMYKKAQSVFSGFAELGQLPAIDAEVRRSDPYDPPASGELTETQVSRYLDVQTRVRSHLGDRFAHLKEKYQTLADRIDRQESGALDLPEILAAYRDLAGAFVDARRAQVQAMNDLGFSRAEYRWVRQQIYLALGLPVLDFNVGGLVQALRQGQTPEEPHIAVPSGPSGPERNRILIEPHKQQLTDNVALTMFGL